METAANKTAKVYSRYGSSVHKQVYIYGGLDMRPTELVRSLEWRGASAAAAVSIPAENRTGRRREVASARGGRTQDTFASHYTQVVSLQEALQLPNIAAYNKRATGEKYLINPNKGG